VKSAAGEGALGLIGRVEEGDATAFLLLRLPPLDEDDDGRPRSGASVDAVTEAEVEVEVIIEGVGCFSSTSAAPSATSPTTGALFSRRKRKRMEGTRPREASQSPVSG